MFGMMFNLAKQRYSSLKPAYYNDDVDDIPDGTTLLQENQIKQASVSLRWIPYFIINLTIMIACVGGGYLFGKRSEVRVWNFDSASIMPSAVHDFFLHTEAGKASTKFTATPLVRDEDPHISEHPWRQAPGPGVDTYFQENFGHGMIFLVSADDMKRMGKDPSEYAHIGEDWGYGDKIYPARFDHTHQMHCIHTLRHMLFPKHYRVSLNASSEVLNPLERSHGEHCLWALYDYLSCHVTWDVYNFKWMDGVARPLPDHSSQRQCRNRELMDEFYRSNDVYTDARVYNLVPQAGDYVHPMSPERKAMGKAVRASSDSLLEGDEWLRQRRHSYDKAMSEWKQTGVIPRIPDS